MNANLNGNQDQIKVNIKKNLTPDTVLTVHLVNLKLVKIFFIVNNEKKIL